MELQETTGQDFKFKSLDDLAQILDKKLSGLNVRPIDLSKKFADRIETVSDYKTETWSEFNKLKGFTGQLRGWWDNYLSVEEKAFVINATAVDKGVDNICMALVKGREDAAYTLILTILERFNAMIDSGADVSCIQEGLVPTKYFQNTTHLVKYASGHALDIEYKLPNTHAQDFSATYQDREISYSFVTDPVTRDINALINMKQRHVNSLQSEILSMNIFDTLQSTKVQQKIKLIAEQMAVDVCADHPSAFWNRKRHIVTLPYEENFSEDDIPTKYRPFQMNAELVEFCKNEIDSLLQKGLIKPSKSPWLKKDHKKPWTDQHTTLVKNIKQRVKSLPCLALANPT
ncbi:uncharacterized protein [Nicotiana sylvestris]|uniref:uncharacterized protein n=1 Tax=Nicotiana sylvestris TaxID=4096 RepID=UPI00388C63C3